MIFRLMAALLLAALLPFPLYAVTVEGLYGATVPVADRSSAESERGLAEAFAQVLVKLTGDSGSASDARFAKLRRKARSFVTVLGQAEGGSVEEGFRLRVEFDPRALAAALGEVGVEPWPKERPALRTWLAVQDAEGRRFSPAEKDRSIFDALAQRANERGIPLERPPLPSLSAKPGRGLLEALLPEADTPEASPALALLLERGENAIWKFSARQLLEGKPAQWTATGEDPVALVRQGMDEAGDRLGRHLASAVTGAATETVSLRLLGLRSAGDFGRAMAQLRGLDVVRQVDISRASDDALELRLSARGGLAGITQGLRLDPAFVAEPGAPGTWRFNGAAR